MEIAPKDHRHPVSGVLVYGYLLSQFDRLSRGDVYASKDGTWKRCRLVGVRHTGRLVCVRPIAKNFKQ